MKYRIWVVIFSTPPPPLISWYRKNDPYGCKANHLSVVLSQQFGFVFQYERIFKLLLKRVYLGWGGGENGREVEVVVAPENGNETPRRVFGTGKFERARFVWGVVGRYGREQKNAGEKSAGKMK